MRARLCVALLLLSTACIAALECRTDSDCDDHNRCTTDMCDYFAKPHVCTHFQVPGHCDPTKQPHHQDTAHTHESDLESWQIALIVMGSFLGCCILGLIMAMQCRQAYSHPALSELEKRALSL